MISHPGLVASRIDELKKLDVKIALDDFGSGYASFNTFLSIPLDEVKIDREIMLKSTKNPLIKNFIKSIVHLFHNHNLTVIGEGIEDLEMVTYAQDNGIDCLQGYYFSKPISTKDALELPPKCLE